MATDRTRVAILASKWKRQQALKSHNVKGAITFGATGQTEQAIRRVTVTRELLAKRDPEALQKFDGEYQQLQKTEIPMSLYMLELNNLIARYVLAFEPGI